MAVAAIPNYQIGGLLEKMTNVDKDFRYMAGWKFFFNKFKLVSLVNDLMVELGKTSITLDEDMEKRVWESIKIIETI